MREIGDLDGLFEGLEELKGRRGISRVKITQLVEALQAQLEDADVVYVRAKELVKESVHFNDPRYVGVCLSMLRDVTPDSGVGFDVEKYSKSWRVTRATF